MGATGLMSLNANKVRGGSEKRTSRVTVGAITGVDKRGRWGSLVPCEHVATRKEVKEGRQHEWRVDPGSTKSWNINRILDHA